MRPEFAVRSGRRNVPRTGAPVLRLGFHLAANNQIAVVHKELDIFFLHAGIRQRPQFLFGFGDFELRPRGFTKPARCRQAGIERSAKSFLQEASFPGVM